MTRGGGGGRLRPSAFAPWTPHHPPLKETSGYVVPQPCNLRHSSEYHVIKAMFLEGPAQRGAEMAFRGIHHSAPSQKARKVPLDS